MEGPLIMLICAATFLIFVIACAIVGFCMFRIGLYGQVRRMMADADDARKAKSEDKKDIEPSHIPGSEFNPLEYGWKPRYDPELATHWSYREDEDGEEDEKDTRFVTDDDIEEAELDEEPVVPGKKHKVVMTGGGESGNGYGNSFGSRESEGNETS